MKKSLILMLVVFLALLASCQKNDINSKDTIEAPTEVLVYSTSYREVVIEGNELIEYSIDNGQTWNETVQLKVRFANLEPDTDYEVLYRFIETETTLASPAARVTVKTKALPFEGEELDKILIIGNQNSQDSATHLYDLITDYELAEDLLIGSIIKTDESLSLFAEHATSNTERYDYVKQISSDNSETTNETTILETLIDEPWDLVIIEQTNAEAGILREYTPHLNDLIEFIKNNNINDNLKIAFQMPWAYSENSDLESFDNYRNDQIRMYNSIVSRMEDSILSNEKIDLLIPSGTAIQNLRTTIIKEDEIMLTNGELLNNVGRIATSLTTLKTLYDIDLDDITTINNVDSDTIGAISESVESAIVKPLEITRSVNYNNPYKDRLYMLSIGNSFTQDAYVYLAQMLTDIGVKDFVIGYLYRGGESLSGHLNHIQNDNQYDQYRIWNNSTNMIEMSGDKTIKKALKDFDWDVVTVQQVSGNSGVPLSFRTTLTPLLELIKENNPNDDNTKYGYHMTWAYAKDSDHWNYGKYDNNQMVMYEKIVETTVDMVLKNELIDFIVPAGTAIQNLRGTSVGDTVTRDGYHLNGLGQYTAGLMWVKTLTNVELDLITYQPVGVNVGPNISLIHRAVNNAHIEPYEISN